jgi:hypothetical protein
MRRNTLGQRSKFSISKDSLKELTLYREELISRKIRFEKEGYPTDSIIINAELSGVNRVIDILNLRSDVVVYAKLHDEGKINLHDRENK